MHDDVINLNNFIERYGRLTVILIGMTCGSVIGLIKSFSTNYMMYMCVSDWKLFFFLYIKFNTLCSTFSLSSSNRWEQVAFQECMY